MAQKKGCVYLIGAGPGDPGLLTVKAARLLEQADVVIYDRLVSEDILGLIPAGRTRIFAGKSCKDKAMTQEEINQLLVTLARRGMEVVRLKGGDPLLFGRGGEEAEYLAERGIGFEIVPGVTSATGCAAYAGIPLTYRGLATGVRFVTGHRMKEDAEQPLQLNWKSLADPDTTLVVYMGLANLETLCRELAAHGLDATTPAAVIQEGTTPRQRVVIGTLQDIAAKAQKAELQPPTTVIIGRVAALAGKLEWFNAAPRATPRSRKAGRR